jgi:hypothetical protein
MTRHRVSFDPRALVVGAAILFLPACPRSVPLDYSEVKPVVDGQIKIGEEWMPYDVDFEKSEMTVAVLSDPDATGFVCSMLSHPHAIQAMRFSSKFRIDAAAPADSFIEVTVPGLALNPDNPETVDRFDGTKERTEVSKGDREGTKGTAFTQLKIDDFPDLVFRVKNPPAVEGSEEEIVIEAEMAGVKESIEAKYTASMQGDAYIVDVTGFIDAKRWGMFESGMGMDCVNKSLPLNATLVLVPKN